MATFTFIEDLKLKSTAIKNVFRLKKTAVLNMFFFIKWFFFALNFAENLALN